MSLTSVGHGINGTDLVGCISSLDILETQGPSLQALTHFRGLRFIARHLRHFGCRRVYLGYGPVPGPTLKKALYHTRPFVGACDKYH